MAWPQVLEEATLKEAEEAARAQLRTRLDEIASTGIVDVAEFAIESMPEDAMLELIRSAGSGGWSLSTPAAVRRGFRR